VTQTSKAALLINTGSSKNLGDRAMLFNLYQLLSARGVKRIYSIYPVAPSDLEEATELIGYTALSSRLGRLSSLGVKPDSFIVTLELFTLFAGLCLFCIPSLLNSRWRFSSLLERDELLAAINRSDFILFSGGGYLTDQGRLEARACLLTGILGTMLGKPIYFSGQWIGPVEEPITRFLLRFVARRARRILLRDQAASQKLLLSLHVDPRRMRESGDDALTLATPESASEPVADTEKQKILGVHLRLTPFGNKSAQIIENTKSIFQPLMQAGWQLRFYQFAAQSTWETDIYTQITQGMEQNAYTMVALDDPGMIRHSVAECTVCIGMAYHFLLFALAESVPAIGIYSGPYYRQKLEGLYGWYGRQEWVLNQDRCRGDTLLKLVQSLDDESATLSRELGDSTDRLSSNYLKDMDELLDMAMEQ